MANWRKKEEEIRNELSKYFGMKLEKKAVKLKGTEKTWEADFVSEDGSIVGEIKTADFKGIKTSAIARNICCPYLYLFNTIGAKRRILILTKKRLYDLIKERREGEIALNSGIEIYLWKHDKIPLDI